MHSGPISSIVPRSTSPPPRPCSVLWTSAIAATHYVSVVWRLGPEQTAAMLPRYAAVSLGVPALLTVLPALDAGSYGPAGGWCWITEAKQYW